MNKWEKFFDEKIREIAKEKVIRDIGGGAPFSKSLSGYREYFKNADYQTLDCDPDSQPDIVGDMNNLPLGDESVDAVICKSVLEHAPEPHRVAGEIYRVLKKGGKCFVYAPFLYVYHGGKTYQDYYRYTEDGIRYLFKKFSTIEVCPMKGQLETLVNLLPCQSKFPRGAVASLARLIDLISEKHQSKKQVAGFSAFLTK